MKKIARIVSMLLALILCMGAIPFVSIQASAASNWPSLSDSSYCEFTASKTIYVYRDMSFSARGTCIPSKSYNAYIEAGDVLLKGFRVGKSNWRIPKKSLEVYILQRCRTED